MTAAERQRKRRARLRGENPPRKPGRPRFFLAKKASLADNLLLAQAEAVGTPIASVRRRRLNREYVRLGEYVLRIKHNEENFVPEHLSKFRPLRKKTILEQFGRHAWYLVRSDGATWEETSEDAIAWAEELLKQEGKLRVNDVVQFFLWLREKEPEEDEPPDDEIAPPRWEGERG
jgi:hypothetical protein